MKKCRTWFMGLLSIALLAVVSGCSSDFDAAAYVEGVLDNSYFGESEKYIKQVKVEAEEAKKQYEDGLVHEAQFFMKFMDIENCSDEVTQQIIEMYREIYAKAKYNVGIAEADGDNFKVKVTVEPILIMKENWTTLFAVWSDTYDTVLELSEEEQCDAIGKALVKELTPRIETITYGEAQTIEAVVEKQSETLYSFTMDSFNDIDILMIDYNVE